MRINFPYTNFHELNLDWILNKIRGVDDIKSRVDENTKNIKDIYNLIGSESAIVPAAEQRKLEGVRRKVAAITGTLKAWNKELDNIGLRIGNITPEYFFIYVNGTANTILMNPENTGSANCPGRIRSLAGRAITTNTLQRVVGVTGTIFNTDLYVNDELRWSSTSQTPYENNLYKRESCRSITTVITNTATGQHNITRITTGGIDILRDYIPSDEPMVSGGVWTNVIRPTTAEMQIAINDLGRTVTLTNDYVTDRTGTFVAIHTHIYL